MCEIPVQRLMNREKFRTGNSLYLRSENKDENVYHFLPWQKAFFYPGFDDKWVISISINWKEKKSLTNRSALKEMRPSHKPSVALVTGTPLSDTA